MAKSTVQLMVTCLVDALAPEVGKATLSVLEEAGCEVEFPAGQTCCGQPAYNVGLMADARKMAIHTLEVFEGTTGPIVAPSGSCTAMVANHYPEILEGTEHEEAAKKVSSRIRELSQFLVDDLEKADSIDAWCAGCSIAVHRSCHGLRGLGVSGQVDKLVETVAGVEIVPLDGAEECCGFGGLFSVEMPEVSAAIMDTKLDRVEASGADVLVGGDISCLLHMEGGLRRRNSPVSVRHFVELIAREDDET